MAKQQLRLDKQIEINNKTNAQKKGISFYCFYKYKYVFIEIPRTLRKNYLTNKPVFSKPGLHIHHKQ